MNLNDMKHRHPKAELPIFITDCTLGRLAKWLRLAGMDTRMDLSTPDPAKLERISKKEQRMVLTRTNSVFEGMGPSNCIFIQSDYVMDQARQVVGTLHLQPNDLRILSRCSTCNHLLSKITSSELHGRVSDYITLQYKWFMTCRNCMRVYWPGSHASNINSIIEGWFGLP